MDGELKYQNKPESNRARRRQAGSFRTILLAFIAVAILAAAGYWLSLSKQEKDNLREMAAAWLTPHLEGTPIAGLAAMLKPAPPPLPPQVLNPPTTPGTLAGQQVASTIAAPLDFGPGLSANLIQPRHEKTEQTADSGQGFSGASERQAVVFSQEPVPAVTEDSRIKPDYITSLAKWLANHYKPGPEGGALIANVQALNQECGGRLAARAQGGRAALLQYAFHPAMINGLYNLYIDRFMRDLDSAGKEKGLNPGQNRQFHRAIAGRAAAIASELSGVLRVSDLTAKLAHIDDLAQKTVDANAALTTAVFELDQLREAKAGRQEQTTAQMRVDGATARYRRASEAYAQAQAALAAEIRRYSGQNMDEESALFMAAWVARRYGQGGQARGAVESCITALRDFSARCARYGEGS